MDLHAEIMNIPANIVLTGPEGVGNVHSNPYIAYKEGHRDARHAAAELSLKTQAKLDKALELLTATVNPFDKRTAQQRHEQIIKFLEENK